MSNPLSIAAVTSTLRKLLEDGIKSDPDLTDTKVTTQPPDKVANTGNQVNLFLYQVSLNPAWRNADMPQQTKSGETGQPPLPLILHYLVSANGKTDDNPDPFSHRLLGRAMSILYDHPILSSADIKAALPPPPDQQKFDLFDQIEHVRITWQPVSADEMSKLWTTFQAKYRLSTVYQASVVLIESGRARLAPLPVLKRGPKDEGAIAQGNLLVPYPTLTEVELPKKQPSARLGDTIILRGHHLDGDGLKAIFNSPRLSAPLSVTLPPIATAEPTEVSVSLPSNPAAQAAWVAGFYTVALEVARSSDTTNPVRLTNELAFSLAPTITTLSPTNPPAAGGNFTLTLKVSPQVRPPQRASLLFGALEIMADAHLSQTDTLTFLVKPITAASKGKYFVRLRVEGVDSILVQYADPDLSQPQFDDAQSVEVV